ncbi:MAG: metallophosphoesterase [Oscillospiraceae bacterium]|nr:metallophosphoesterase [Oscillospiraceae bacterium]
MRTDTLQIDVSRPLRLLQLSDIHLATWQGGKFITSAHELVKNAVKATKPDIIAITGDLITCYNPVEVLSEFCELMDTLGVPWGFCFGNHDRDNAKDPHSMETVLENSRTCLYRTGDDHVFGYGNYSIKLTDSNGKIRHVLYFIDNSSKHKYDGLSGYICGSQSQNRWFRASQFELLREYDDFNTWVFVHLPLPEYPASYKKNGGVGPKIFECDALPINTGLFCTLAEDKTVKGVFCGHDHGMGFMTEDFGIKLIYGRSSGYNLDRCGVPVTEVGARLCEIEPSGEMKTTFWLDNGTWRNADDTPLEFGGGTNE